VIYAETHSQELARLSELVQTQSGFATARGDSVLCDSMRFNGLLDGFWANPIDKTIVMSSSENVVSNRGAACFACCGRPEKFLIFGVRPRAAQVLSEGDQLNSYEDPALTGEQSVRTCGLGLKASPPSSRGCPPAVRTCKKTKNPLN